MKKVVKIIGIFLGVLILAVAILSLLAKDKNHIHITSKETINAPVNIVYDQIRTLKKYPDWSPFKLEDPEQKHNVTGTDGQVGATFHWEGVAEESKGYQKITSLEGNKKVEIDCNITVPFEAQPKFVYSLGAGHNSTEVTLDFYIDMDFPSNIFAYLFDLEQEMSNTNQKGLELLKDVLEKKS